MASDALSVFFGEFLTSVLPLELSLNACSHACAYCFSRLNARDRRADVRALMRLLAEYQERQSLEAVLLRQGYPVLMSNRTDPFAASNYAQTLALLEVFRGIGTPVSIQTRGGQGIEEALRIMAPSVWYISINSLDDEIRRRVEPGAPDIDSRFALIYRLRELGHRVVLGLNPVVPEWLPEGAGPLLRRARDAGVEGVWLENLHMNYRQEGVMLPWERAALGQELISRSRKRVKTGVDKAAFFEARAETQELGLPMYSIGQPDPSTFWDLYRQVYPRTFPTSQDFVNHCYEHDLGGELIPFSTFSDRLLPRLPEGVLPVAHYLGATAHQIWWTHNVPHRMSYRDLLAIIWQDHRTRQCPARHAAFAYAGVKAAEGWLQLVDDKDMPYVVLTPGGNDTYFVEVDLPWQPAEDPGARASS